MTCGIYSVVLVVELLCSLGWQLPRDDKGPSLNKGPSPHHHTGLNSERIDDD